MGNKHSSSGGQRASDPTARSFSWQPEPGFSHLNVQHNMNPPMNGHGQLSGHFPPFMDENCNHPIPVHSPGSPGDSLRHRNGSVVKDDAAFGGVFMAQQEQPNSNRNWSGPEDFEAPQSPSKKSRPGTTDSGYLTGLDSDPTTRSRMRGSRLSLNEAVFEQNEFHGPQQVNIGGYPMAPRPHFSPPPPPGGFSSPHFPPAPMFIGPPVPQNFDSKQAKKWHKKQSKELKKLHKQHRHQSLGPMQFGLNIPSGQLHPVPPPPFRAQSMENLAAFGLMNPMPEPMVAQPMPVLPPGMRRRSSSQMDLSASGPIPPWMMPVHPSGPMFQHPPQDLRQMKKDRKAAKMGRSPGGTGRSMQISEKTSVSSDTAKSSRRSRGGSIAQEPTFFEEERPLINNQGSKTETNLNSKINFFKTPGSPQCAPHLQKDQQAIYETLKAKKVLATAEIVREPLLNSSHESNEHSHKLVKPSTEQCLPTKISPEAQAVMERNAQILGMETTKNEEVARELEEAKPELLDAKQVSEIHPVPYPCHENSVQEKNEIPEKYPDTAGETEITAILNPLLPRRRYGKPKDFEPLQAWQSINVENELAARRVNRMDKSAIVEENILVHLIPTAPSKSDSTHGEPIYFEYDEKLPDFKKRLIETGSFDFPEKFQHSSDKQSGSRKEGSFLVENSELRETKEQLDATTEDLESAPKVEEKEKRNSLRRLKNSFKEMFARSKSAERSVQPASRDSAPKTRHNPDLLYNSTGSLTPSTANIKAGDSSDIDFSWVHDLETKFRREKDHFDSEFEVVNQRSLRRGLQNPTAAVPVADYHNSGRQNGCYRNMVNVESNGVRGYGQQNGFSLADAVGYSTPAQNRAVYTLNPISAAADESLDNCFPPNPSLCPFQNPAPTKYFGIYDDPAGGSSGHRVTHLGTESQIRQEELRDMSNNVRLKAALFEHEAQRSNDLSRNKLESRNMQDRRISQEVGPGHPYIPQPDYDNEMSSCFQQNHMQGIPIRRSLYDERGVISGQQLSVDTNPARVQAPRISRSPRSPSQRIIHRLEHQRQHEGWIASGVGEVSQPSPGSSVSGQGLRYVHDSRLAAYNVGKGYVNGGINYQAEQLQQHNAMVNGGQRLYSDKRQRQTGSDLKLNGHCNGGGVQIYGSQPVLGGVENSYLR